jgi:serine/threonine protein phosphatase 1
MKREIYVIGDSHGCFLTVKALIDKLPKNSRIIFTGDMIDRGPRSRELLDYIIENRYESCLGNHEEFMIESSFKDGIVLPTYGWTQNGGCQTLESYGEENIETFKRHIEWLKTLPLYIYVEVDGHKPLVVSHSVIQHVWKGKDVDYSSVKDTILWDHISRNEGFTFNRSVNVKDFYDHKGIFNIFGHTPLNGGLITESVAAIDSGCCYKRHVELGVLTAIHYPSLEKIEQKNID